MKFVVLTLLFCAFVATAFAVPLSTQDEAGDIAAKFQDAIPKLEKAVTGLRAEGQTEAADKVENLIPLLKIWTNRETVQQNIAVAKVLLKSVERLLDVTRRYWENSALSVSSVDVNVAISEFFANSEAQDLVNKFLDSIPKLEKVERGLRADGQTEAADKLKQAIPAIKIYYTNLAFVQQNIEIARQVWKNVEHILEITRKYWDNSLFVSTLSVSSVDVNAAISDLIANSEAQDLVNNFLAAIPKLEKVERGLRADGQTEAADKLKQAIPALKIFYTNVDFVQQNIEIARQVWKNVEHLLDITRKYWENAALSVSSVDVNAAISEFFASSEAQELVNKFKDAIPKLEKVEKGLRADGQTEVADRVKNAIPILKKTYTNVELVEQNIVNARQVWQQVENALNATRKYWDNSALSVSSASLNLAISELVANSEAQDLVNKFLDSIPKLEKVERGLRADGQTEAADKLKQAIPAIKIYYTNLAFVQQNIEIARQVWKNVQHLLDITRHYWDNSLFVSTLSKSLINEELSALVNSVAALDENEDPEVTEIVNQFKEAIPKVQKISDGLRRDGQTEAADNIGKLAESLEKYTQEDFVREHKLKSKIVLKGVQFVIRLGKKYLEEEQSAIVITQF